MFFYKINFQQEHKRIAVQMKASKRVLFNTNMCVYLSKLNRDY